MIFSRVSYLLSKKKNILPRIPYALEVWHYILCYFALALQQSLGPRDTRNPFIWLVGWKSERRKRWRWKWTARRSNTTWKRRTCSKQLKKVTQQRSKHSPLKPSPKRSLSETKMLAPFSTLPPLSATPRYPFGPFSKRCLCFSFNCWKNTFIVHLSPLFEIRVFS